jgi:hypothetical protein
MQLRLYDGARGEPLGAGFVRQVAAQWGRYHCGGALILVTVHVGDVP